MSELPDSADAPAVDALPARQRDVIRLIIELTDKHGYPPTLAELARALGLRNRMTVHQHVAALKKKGMVHWEPGLNRSLRVLSHCMSDTRAESGRDEESAPRGVPLAGQIAAGQPIDAIECTEYLEVETQYASAGCFALKVKGDSMIDDGIYDGDFVIVKPNPSPRNGEIVVAVLDDGNATLKRFYKEKAGFRLQPSNKDMQPIFVASQHELMIQGIVVALFRKM